ncbi:MAG: glycosyltransferase family 9 protein [Candidatus Omnitrophica bacterium]|nr:glycosyltransferase family 9 protein [Candidatus Omnitrophota bacterium]
MMRPEDRDGVQKILVVTLSNLGDVVLTLPVFQSLRRAFPGARLHVVVGPAGAEVFTQDPRIDRVVVYDKKGGWSGKLGLLRRIRAERYDLVVDLRKSLFGLLAGARFRNPVFFFSRSKKHRALRHWKSLKPILNEPSIPEESFLRTDFGVSPLIAEALSSSDRRLVVACVGSKSDLKKWPAASYARLLDRLASESDCRIFLAGGAEDKKDSQAVAELMKQPVTDLTGGTTFVGLCQLLRAADLVVTNDSAPLHVADSLRVPALAVFGPTDPVKYGPRFHGSAVARRVLFCAPCERAQCRFHHECMKELGADEVYRQAVRVLEGEGRPHRPRILAVRLDRIGDVLLSLPALAILRRRFPDAWISVMVRPSTREILEGHPLIDEVIPYDYSPEGRDRFPLGYLRFLRGIAKRRFDIACVLRPGVRSHLAPFLAGIPRRVGFRRCGWRFFLTQTVSDRRHEGLRHESEYTADVVRQFGGEEGPADLPPYPVFSESDQSISGLLSEERPGQGHERLIAFHAGASCPSKRWPKESFAWLGKAVLAGLPHRLVLIGGGRERETSEFLKAEWGARALDLTGRLNLRESAALLKRCEVLVSNDSGPVHLAAAVGTRTLTIFGRNQDGLSRRRWRALGAGHETIQKDVGCVVCLAHRCSIGFECLKAISVEEVFERLKQMVGK